MSSYYVSFKRCAADLHFLERKRRPFRMKTMMTMIEDTFPVLYMCIILRNRYLHLHLPGYGSDKVHSQRPAWA